MDLQGDLQEKEEQFIWPSAILYLLICIQDFLKGLEGVF